jgi:hypothetical protein
VMHFSPLFFCAAFAMVPLCSLSSSLLRSSPSFPRARHGTVSATASTAVHWAALHRPSSATIHPPTGAPGHGDAPMPLPRRRRAPSRPEPNLLRRPLLLNCDQGLAFQIKAFPGG